MLKTLELGVVGLPHRRPQLQYNDLFTVVQSLQCTADDGVSPHKAVTSQDDELVGSGDFIELASCQV